jgi:hypothetical protein
MPDGNRNAHASEKKFSESAHQDGTPSRRDVLLGGPSVADKQGWNAKIAPQEPIYDTRKGEKPKVVGLLDVDNRRTKIQGMAD